MAANTLERINISFTYRNRKWMAEVRKMADGQKLSYRLIYYPVQSPSLSGEIEIFPPGGTSHRTFWKQRRHSLEENMLDPEFINIIGAEISNWEQSKN